MNLGYSDLTYIEGDAPILCLDHFVHTHILCEEPDYSISMLYGRMTIWLPNQPFKYILVNVLHCSFIGWERHAKASQDHLALVGEIVWRQHSRPRLYHRLTLKSPVGHWVWGWLLGSP
jgi:hypothetical protein